MKNVSHPFKNLKYDLPAGLVLALVALPLCLGIALASGAPLLSGLLAGVIGGIVVGALSGSSLSVSGPAAGLTTIVLTSVDELRSFEAFLFALVVSGILQVVLGFLKAGTLGNYFPSSVIKGMLAAIGLILILKQIPHALGYDRDYEGDESFLQPDGENTFTEILKSLDYLTPGAVLIFSLCFFLLLIWENKKVKEHKYLHLIPGPLLIVVAGVCLNHFFIFSFPGLALEQEHLVNIPAFGSWQSFSNQFQTPDFSAWQNGSVYLVAITLAVVASLESLLSIEAADKLDPYRRITPLNRELKAQGIGNIVSGLLGGLPVTAVVVRTTANITAGARSKASAIFHGILLLVSVLAFPAILNTIPLSALAAILLLVGYKLCKPALVIDQYKKGFSQFTPFVVTILAILFTDLLIGIAIGLAVGLYFVLKTNFHHSISIIHDKDQYLIRLNRDVSFLNKSVLRKTLEEIPEGSSLIIDGGNSQFIDEDIIETLQNFIASAPTKNIDVEIKKTYSAPNLFFRKTDQP
ncbi:MAG: SulP family inorganic anion transporter [Cyclobacteriaceae bacterium]|nr:SulP family inorganic anion transporter [Cytophagales bacterium]MCZ8327121.1 SulP family inorganic anion transporter [Cyclobacteriaceae bacterium]